MQYLIYLSFLVSIFINDRFMIDKNTQKNILNIKLSDSSNILQQNITNKYENIFSNQPKSARISFDAFQQGILGFYNLIENNLLSDSAYILTICDFNLSSNKKRLWVIDVKSEKLIFHTLVSHGKNTGEEYAVNFSNKINSYQSSLGFYKTANTYDGSNGFSLRLIGLDEGINSNAFERAIVMHGADYCSEEFIMENNRLGRSFGCPAIPQKYAKQIMETIKDNQCLYIHYNDINLLKQSKWLNKTPSLATINKFELTQSTN